MDTIGVWSFIGGVIVAGIIVGFLLQSKLTDSGQVVKLSAPLE